MGMTLQNIRDFVREHLDVDTNDLSNDLLDRFIREGSQRIERDDIHWPFYQKMADFTVAEGATKIAKTDIASDLEKIVALRRADNGQHLNYVGTSAELWKLSPTSSSSYPQYYSLWGDNVLLWPKPSSSAELEALYYRAPKDWVSDGSGAEPDLPDQLHNTVAVWALACAYAHQEDSHFAGLYFQKFEDELFTFKRSVTEMPHPQPIVLNGGGVKRRSYALNPRLDWM